MRYKCRSYPPGEHPLTELAKTLRSKAWKIKSLTPKTPGEWPSIEITDHMNNAICEVNTMWANYKANARLIAIAPTLLATLESLVSAYYRSAEPVDYDLLNEAKAAIDYAKGDK